MTRTSFIICSVLMQGLNIFLTLSFNVPTLAKLQHTGLYFFVADVKIHSPSVSWKISLNFKVQDFFFVFK